MKKIPDLRSVRPLPTGRRAGNKDVHPKVVRTTSALSALGPKAPAGTTNFVDRMLSSPPGAVPIGRKGSAPVRRPPSDGGGAGSLPDLVDRIEAAMLRGNPVKDLKKKFVEIFWKKYPQHAVAILEALKIRRVPEGKLNDGVYTIAALMVTREQGPQIS